MAVGDRILQPQYYLHCMGRRTLLFVTAPFHKVGSAIVDTVLATSNVAGVGGKVRTVI
jgi:hypothetical protein